MSLLTYPVLPEVEAEDAGTAAASRLLARFKAVRAASLTLCAPLSPEDLMVQSCAEASPAKWHLAHTSWFYETFILREFAPGYKDFHPDFHWLFNSYYTSLGEMPEKKLRASFSRPPLDAILAYREHVDGAVTELLGGKPGAMEQEALKRVALGLEHEQQHQELIATDIKHALFTNPLHPAYLVSPAAAFRARESTIAPPMEFVDFEGGLTEVGVTPEAGSVESFAFDNETPRHTVYLEPFALATREVTCAEYLSFIEDRGYTRPELWLSEGWSTMRAEGWQAPLYWQPSASKGGAASPGWVIYTLHGFKCLEELSETPVCHLSFFEADAFARWSSLTHPGNRLPTEFEWEHAAASVPKSVRANLLDSEALHTVAADGPAADGPAGLKQMFGDTWEWTASGYTGYPGYHPLPGALGEYNGKFMSSQIILRGGSCVTPASHIRATYRNFFPPATRWQFSGLRLAKDVAKRPATEASRT